MVRIQLIAITATFLNLYQYGTGKDYKLTMAMGLSFTASTVAADYNMVSNRVKAEDWSASTDVVLSTATALLTILSILLNSVYTFRIKK